MHSQEEIFKEVQQAMVELFELDPADITTDATLYQDLDLDSIDAVDLVVRMQNFTGQKMAPDEFRKVRTVQDIINAIEKLLAE